MKLTCPKCYSKLRIPAEKVPATGAWACCPKCQERFFVRPVTEQKTVPDTFAASQPGASKPVGLRGRDQDSQRLLERMRQKRPELKTADYPPVDFSAITLYPEYVSSPVARQVVTGILLVAPLLVMAVIFHSSSQVGAQPMVASTLLIKMNDDANIDLIRRDLRNMRRYLQKYKNSVNMEIDYSGPESRIFNYFMDKMVPGVCEGNGITLLHLAANPASNGFKATGTCAGSKRQVEMQVTWQERLARISFTNFPKQGYEDIEIYPIASRHAAFKNQAGGVKATAVK